MSNIDDIRAELASRRPERSGATSTILAALGAFAVGGVLVLGWQFMPAATPSATPRTAGAPRDAEVKISTTGDRLGDPVKAPLLQTCVTSQIMTSGGGYQGSVGPRRSNPHNSSDDSFFPLDAAQLYAMLKMTNTATALVQSAPGAVGLMASSWGMLAECLVNKDAAMLCDSNNRALAIEAVTNLVRQSGSALAQPNVSANMQLSQLANLKERVMVGFRGHLRDGSIAAGDFGFFAPDEIKRLARETKPVRDACAAAAKTVNKR